MTLVTVQFYSLWRLCLGLDRLSLEADNVEKALAEIEERFGARLREQLQSRRIQVDGKIQDYSIVLVNGINLRNLEQTELKEGDILHILPLGAGG